MSLSHIAYKYIDKYILIHYIYIDNYIGPGLHVFGLFSVRFVAECYRHFTVENTEESNVAQVPLLEGV